MVSEVNPRKNIVNSTKVKGIIANCETKAISSQEVNIASYNGTLHIGKNNHRK